MIYAFPKAQPEHASVDDAILCSASHVQEQVQAAQPCFSLVWLSGNPSTSRSGLARPPCDRMYLSVMRAVTSCLQTQTMPFIARQTDSEVKKKETRTTIPFVYGVLPVPTALELLRLPDA